MERPDHLVIGPFPFLTMYFQQVANSANVARNNHMSQVQ